MKKLVFLSILAIISTLQSSCSKYKRTQISGDNLVYASANLIDDAQQSKIINLYGNLKTIQKYNIALQYKIYTNKNSLCDKSDRTILKINSMNDAWLCFDDFYIISCNQVWQLLQICGTFVEVHRPFDPKILISMNVQELSWIQDKNGIKVINMDLKGLCIGMYHLWFTYYSRMGQFLKGIKPIYITYPSCQC